MLGQLSIQEYIKALRLGQKERKERAEEGLNPYPEVLEEMIPDLSSRSIQELPLMEIPLERIRGTKTAGRVNAFSASFFPLLEADSEFAAKWLKLCEAHLSDTGLKEPILCYEYLGDFYIQEGHKRVSVLQYFGAARVSARVKRVLPLPREAAYPLYQEFLAFFKVSGLYDIRFHKSGDYARLLAALGFPEDVPWTEEQRRTFRARYHYFREAFQELNASCAGPGPEEALLIWLKVYPYDAFAQMSPQQLKTSLAALWDDVLAGGAGELLEPRTKPDTESLSILEKLVSPPPSHLRIALLYQEDPLQSPWTKAHEEGARQMQAALGGQAELKHYFHADSPEQCEKLLEEAISEGAQVIFTTTPLMLRSTLKAAVKNPKVRFLNCSVDTPLSSVRSYYCRTYEGKFITGLIAGAMAENDQIGYVGSYPILGVPASINAFALGARTTNPRARIYLEWSAQPGDAVRRLKEKGIRLVSNRDIPLKNQSYMTHGHFGTYLMDQDGALKPLASPVWLWGKLYEQIVRSILDGSWSRTPEAINYWWGMDSGVIDVELTHLVPEGLRSLAGFMVHELREGRLNPFHCPIRSQDGRLRNDGSRYLTPQEILRMDWLCENVEGHIPAFHELSDMARPLVRQLGIYRDSIPPEIEGGL